MFCQNCGKQLADHAKFCSNCGQPVAYEENMPEDEGLLSQPGQEKTPEDGGTAAEKADGSDAREEPSQTNPPAHGGGGDRPVPMPLSGPEAAQPILSGAKYRGKVAVGLLAGAAVVVIVLVVALANLVLSLGRGESVYLYANDDHELIYLEGLKENSQGIELTDQTCNAVQLSSDGKYIYFFEQDSEDYSSYADLYRIETSKIGKDGERPERVSSRVNLYYLTVLENGGAVFLKESGSGEDLYCYDGERDYKLADDTYSFVMDDKEQNVYYTRMDEAYSDLSLFRAPLKEGGQEEELLSGADIIYTPLDADILVYGESRDGDEWGETFAYDVYSVKPGERETLLAEDACNVDSVRVEGGKVSFAYLTRQAEPHTLYDFVSDSTAASDAAAREPNYDDFVTGYSEWGWAEYDMDAYYAARDAWSQVENRIHMREQLKATDYELTYYTLHSYANGTVSTMADGLSSIPASNPDKGIYIYTKSGQEISPVVDLSNLTDYSEVYDYINEEPTATYQNINGVESELNLGDWTGVMGIFPAGGDQMVLYLSQPDGDALVSCKLEKNTLVLGDVLEDRDFSVCYTDNEDVLYYFADINGDYTAANFVRYQDGKATVLAKDAYRVFLLEDGTVFKMEDAQDGVGSLYAVKDGKEERIDDDVYDALFLADDRVLYIGDNDLYLWEKGESTRLARDVTGIWASDALSYDSFYL